MNPISDLREWAGVADDSQDSSLRTVEAGIIRLLESATNRRFYSPPRLVESVLNGPDVETGGMTGIGNDSPQWVTLPEAPRSTLAGTMTVAAGEKTVTGAGTAFLTALSAKPASALTLAGESHLVAAIASDTSLTLKTAHVAGATAATGTASVISIETRYPGETKWTAEDPRKFEVRRRRLYSRTHLFPPGMGTVRVQSTIGFDEGEGPADAVLFVLEMVKVVWRRKSSQGEKSVSVHGGFTITWASLGEEAKAFREKARLIARGVSFA